MNTSTNAHTPLQSDPLPKSECCIHDWIEDWIDIDPDRSQRIVYCRICEITQKNQGFESFINFFIGEIFL